MQAKPNTGSVRTPHILCAALLTCAATFTMLAWGCGKEPPATSPPPTVTNGVSQPPPDTSPPPVVLAPQAVELINDIDQTLAQDYERLHVSVLLGMRGEIMPCGCSDGVRGGLIKFASLARTLKKTLEGQDEPAAFVSLGGNHFRTMQPQQYEPFADYYNQRLQYVDRAIESLTPTLKLLNPAEREFLATLPDITIEDRRSATIRLNSGTVVQLSDGMPEAADEPASDSEAESDTSPWVIVFQSEEGGVAADSPNRGGCSFWRSQYALGVRGRAAGGLATAGIRWPRSGPSDAVHPPQCTGSGGRSGAAHDSQPG
jgi:hypothetical protein